MKVSVKSILKEPSRDNQLQKVYAMDDIFELIIKERSNKNPKYLDKLYGNLENRNDIILLTKKICEDFSIKINSVKVSRSVSTSFCQMSSIYYSLQAFKENCIETVIHEKYRLLKCKVFFYLLDFFICYYIFKIAICNFYIFKRS